MTRATVGFLDENGNFQPVKASRPLPTTGGGGGGGGVTQQYVDDGDAATLLAAQNNTLSAVQMLEGEINDLTINDLNLAGTTNQIIKHNGTGWAAATDLYPPNLTQAQVENEASTVFGLASGQRLAQAINTNDALAALAARVTALENGAIMGDGSITDLVAKTQAEYDALGTKDPTTQYTIKGA